MKGIGESFVRAKIAKGNNDPMPEGDSPRRKAGAMPAEYTHQIIAEKVYEKLPKEVRSRTGDLFSFDLGAQGADIFYFLHPFRRRNLGKIFHNEKVYETFESFRKAAVNADETVLSYIAGYITHYAADCIFHPYVYSLTQKMIDAEPTRRVRWHSYIESDLDTYFVKKFYRKEVNRFECRLRTGKGIPKEVAVLIREVCSANGLPNISDGALRRAVSGYLLFERFFTDKNFRKRRFFERGEKFLHLPQVLSVLCRREDPDQRVLNVSRTQWSNLSDSDKVYEDDADTLFDRAVSESCRLICEFFCDLEDGKTLPREDFGKGFLSGVDTEKQFVRPVRTKSGSNRDSS